MPVGAQSLEELRARRDVHREEDARLGRRRGAADHRLGHVLLHAMDGRACRALWPREAIAACGAERGGGEVRGQILAGDDPAGPVPGDVGQVDALLARHEADGGRGERAGPGRELPRSAARVTGSPVRRGCGGCSRRPGRRFGDRRRLGAGSEGP